MESSSPPTEGASAKENLSDSPAEDSPPVESDHVVDEKNVDPPSEPPVEYPGGIQLMLIMVATLMTLFLAALDQVRSYCTILRGEAGKLP